MAPSLSGQVALVTGATSGIGLETSKALAGLGATVVLGCRNVEAAKKVAESINSELGKKLVVVGPSLDLINQDSVRAFAEYMNKEYKTLDILINNAGVSFMKKTFTSDNVGGIAQTNHLGPYTLTRLLEKKLVASKARVVTVASVAHRTTTLRGGKAFLTEWRCGFYEHSKLANVLFAYELQRQLGNQGVTSCAVDPGGVRSNIWEASPMFKKGVARWMINTFYSPPVDGAQAVIYAATVPWAQDRKLVAGTPVMPAEDLRYYARGIFAGPAMTQLDGYRGKAYGVGQTLKGYVWGVSTLITSFLDWPLRRFSGGKLASGTYAVRSATQTYDRALARELWDASAELAKLPAAPQL